MELLPYTRLVGEGAAETHPVTGFLNEFVAPDTRLFIYASKSPQTVALVREAWETHIPYIPADDKIPVERALYMVEQTAPRLIFADKNTAFYQVIISRQVRLIKEEEEHVLLEVKPSRVMAHEPGLAAILFTSGSTGVPKGVMISRENIAVFTNWMINTYGITGQSSILSVSPLYFDLSVFEIFAAFATGAKLCFPSGTGMVNPLSWAEGIYRYRTNVIYATPSWFRLLVNYGKINRYDRDFVTAILIAGEPLDEKLVRQLQTVFPKAEMANLYGPTETNVCLYYHIPAENIPVRKGMLPIGKACAYAGIQLNSENMLQVSGGTVMMGYWPHPHRETAYNTGDIVEYDATAQLYYFVSRQDRMVKRKGYRIELGDIEACFSKLESVQEVAVTVTGTAEKLRIVAHFVASKLLDPDVLRQHCLQYLPPYMIPDVFKQHQNFPLTGSGKTDYRKLAEYGAQ